MKRLTINIPFTSYYLNLGGHHNLSSWGLAIVFTGWRIGGSIDVHFGPLFGYAEIIN